MACSATSATTTTFMSSAPTRALFPSSSQTLTLPSSFSGLRETLQSRAPRFLSFTPASPFRRSFVVKATSDDYAPLVGNTAPDFEAEAVFDQNFVKVKLSEYVGKKYVILFFYPSDFTFVCPTEFEKLNTEVLGLSIDSVFSHLAWIQTGRKAAGLGNLKYPLISDVTKSISDPYGVQKTDQVWDDINSPSLSSKTVTPLCLMPPKVTEISSRSPPPSPSSSHSEFQEKLLYLDSIGLDFISLIKDHPPITSTSLANIKSVVDLLTSMSFTILDFRRIVSMCPEILTSKTSDILPIFTFLLREAKVEGSDLRRVINRRPRLLVCNVKTRLRPTMYFLQSMGIAEVNKHTYLLSCSVEDKLIPRLEYFQKMGFSRKQTTTMFRRFPQLFNYSIKDTYEPKLNYFVVEMGRDLKELIEFPQYFSFSLEKRIKSRHQACVEKGVCLPLKVLLKTSEKEFRVRLDLCCNASMPFITSPLSSITCQIDSL